LTNSTAANRFAYRHVTTIGCKQLVVTWC